MDGRLGEGVFSLLRCSTTQTQVPEFASTRFAKSTRRQSTTATAQELILNEELVHFVIFRR